MAQKTFVGGTGYEVVDSRPLVNGTGYNIAKGRTLVGDTGYDIEFGIRIGDLSTNESIFADVDGVEKEFLIVNQGIPIDPITAEPSNLYSTTCDGTWVLMKDIHTIASCNDIDGNAVNVYGNMAVRQYLNEDFIALLKPAVQDSVMNVKIPGHKRDGSTANIFRSGEDGLAAKAFVLSKYEFGLHNETISLTRDGVVLSRYYDIYLRELESYAQHHPELVAYYGEAAEYYMTRSIAGHSEDLYIISRTGQAQSLRVSRQDVPIGIRPAMILDPETRVSRVTHRILA